jgi:hypothetical protein
MDQAFSFQSSGAEQGLGDAVDIPITPKFEYLQNFSVETWVFLHPDIPRPGQVEDFVVLGDKFNLRKEADGRLQLFVFIDGELHHLWGEEPLPRGEWIHVVGTYDGGGLSLYQNAIPVDYIELHGELDWAYYFLLSDIEEPLSGLLDEVSIYNRALTLGEVRVLYYLGSGYGKCK